MLVDVTVKIPEERVPAFYAFVGEWLTEAAGAVPAEDEVPDALLSWDAGDEELACEVWSKLSEPAKRVFELLMTNPERRVTAEDLASHIGARDAFTVAGTLAWPGRYCYAVGRKFAIGWSRSDEGSSYWMDAPVAALFSAAKQSGEVGR